MEINMSNVPTVNYFDLGLHKGEEINMFFLQEK